MENKSNTDNDIKKPLSLLQIEFTNNLVNLINNSQLPSFVIELILKDVYKDIALISQKQYELDKKEYQKIVSRKIEN